MKRFFVLCLTLVMALGLVACGGNTTDDGNGGGGTTPVVMDLPEVYTKLTQAVTMPEMYKVEDDMLLDLYGLQAADMKQVVVYDCVDYLRADEIWLIEAVDSAAATRIKEKAQFRLEQLDTESVTYSPEQNAIVKKAQLLQQGNYLALIVSPDVEALAQVFKAEAGL